MPVSACEEWLLNGGQSLESMYWARGDEDVDGFGEATN
jgi:hypothetical protein